MKYYSLQPNEVVIFEEEATLIDTKTDKLLFSSINGELILTNINIVTITKSKKLFSKEQVTVKVFPIEEIKLYNENPQIKQTDMNVEVYLINEKINLSFNSKSKAYKFTSKIIELITGKSISVRGAAKVKGALSLVDDTLGIKTVETVKDVIENGVIRSVFGGVGKKTSNQKKKIDTGSITKDALGFAKDLLNKSSDEKLEEQAEVKIQNNEEVSYDKQIESVKKLKDLLDAGVLSQEEFEIKKKQILGL